MQNVNEDIPADSVLVVGDDGKNLGKMDLQVAISLAKERGMGLLQVSPDDARLVVCKITDLGQHVYSQKRKLAKQRKKK